MLFNKKFSLAHPESMPECPNHFYLIIKNTKREVLDEISDIYFGKSFIYEYNGENKSFGNTMGVEATDLQIDNLFKIQNEFGITISLTMNVMDIPLELQYSEDIQNMFVEWIGSYYDRGLRSCTISFIHLMRTGKLQKRCPLMVWKNTVNHRIQDTQGVIDFIHLGYNNIILDRSYNRNIDELKKTRAYIDNYNDTNKTSILLTILGREGCLSNCPFKKEHDCISSVVGGKYFDTLGKFSCSTWRNTPFRMLPRNGVDLIINSKEVGDEIYPLIDVVKISGRYLSHAYLSESEIKEKNIQLIWINDQTNYKHPQSFSCICAAKSFSSVYENTSLGIKCWELKVIGDVPESIFIENNINRYLWLLDVNLKEDFWLTKESLILEKRLKNCKSQCYNCHLCERMFKMPDIDSPIVLFTI